MPTPILGIQEITATQTNKTTTINDMFVALEGATQDQLALNLAGGNLSLSTMQFTRYAVFAISGQTAAQTLTVPLSKRLFAVRNAGAYTITVGGVSGTSVAVAATSGAIIQCDGTNCAVFGSGGAGATGPTGPAGPIATLVAGAGLIGGTITTSGQTIAADWQLGTVTALGSNIALASGTLQSTDTNIWNAGSVTAVGAGITLTSGTLSAPSGGGTVSEIATVGGIHGGIITDSGTLTVDWNGGTVTTLGSGLALNSGTLDVATTLQKLPLAFAFSGQPGGGQMIHLALINDVPITIPAGFTGTASYVGTNPSLTATFTLSYVRAGTATTIGTVAVASSGAVTLSSGSAYSSMSGDTLRLTAPGTPDATLADVCLTFEAARA